MVCNGRVRALPASVAVRQGVRGGERATSLASEGAKEQPSEGQKNNLAVRPPRRRRAPETGSSGYRKGDEEAEEADARKSKAVAEGSDRGRDS